MDYDADADILYISFRRSQQATDSEMTEEGILLRYKGDELVGITILDASTRSNGSQHRPYEVECESGEIISSILRTPEEWDSRVCPVLNRVPSVSSTGGMSSQPKSPKIWPGSSMTKRMHEKKNCRISFSRISSGWRLPLCMINCLIRLT